jgi:NAD(P)-dependent dehydrogenase (short-subunit alcohol dehydrogenase family)
MKTGLTGRSVVVTGCTRGFGRVLVETLADRGARVVVSGPWPDESEQVATELRAGGGHAVAAPGDVTDPDQVVGLARTAVERFGALDIWINNAALATPVGRAFDLDPSWFERSVAVNVLGTFHGARAAADVMLPAGRGVIVNLLGRGDDVRPTPHTSPYGASKAWARSFTRSLQKEYDGTGVHVMGFNPGMMLTDMLLAPQVVGAEGEAAMRPYGTITRIFGDPPEVAAAALVRALERPTPPASLRLLGPAGIARHVARAAGRGITRRPSTAPAPRPQRIDA